MLCGIGWKINSFLTSFSLLKMKLNSLHWNCQSCGLNCSLLIFSSVYNFLPNNKTSVGRAECDILLFFETTTKIPYFYILWSVIKPSKHCVLFTLYWPNVWHYVTQLRVPFPELFTLCLTIYMYACLELHTSATHFFMHC